MRFFLNLQTLDEGAEMFVDNAFLSTHSISLCLSTTSVTIC